MCAHVCVFFSIFFAIISLRRYQMRFPVLYSRSLLLVYFKYNSMYMSIPVYPSILPFPFGSHSLFSMSVNLFLFCK